MEQGKTKKGYLFEKALGKGYSAVVYSACIRAQGEIRRVAIKAISHEFMNQSPKTKQLILGELKALKQSQNHPNIIHFIENFSDSLNLYIVTQFCNGGTLQKYLQSKGRLSEGEAIWIMKQILNGFYGLHKIKTMHRDFKSQNILLHNGHIKIADLGFAKQLQPNSMTATIAGTLNHQAPEILEGKPYGYKADIWSLGVVFYQMLYGKFPFTGQNYFALLSNVLRAKPDFESVIISPEVLSFLKNCFQVQPRKRISWAQIYSHPLFSQSFKPVCVQTFRKPTSSPSPFRRHLTFYQKNSLDLSLEKIQTPKNDKTKNQSLEKQTHRINRIPSQNNIIIKTNFPPRLDITKTKAQSRSIVLSDDKQNPQSNRRRTPSVQRIRKQNKVSPEYLERYNSYRDKIMFVFNFIIPYESKLSKIKANHDITMFILLKKAYHFMKQFNRRLAQKRNCMKFDQNQFKQFTLSQVYQNISQYARGYLDFIERQAISYRHKIQDCTDQIRNEFDISPINLNQFNKIVEKISDEYWRDLAQNLDNPQVNKQDIIRVIQAMEYIKGKDIVSCRLFRDQLSKLNFGEAENNIRRRLAKMQ